MCMYIHIFHKFSEALLTFLTIIIRKKHLNNLVQFELKIESVYLYLKFDYYGIQINQKGILYFVCSPQDVKISVRCHASN